MKRWACWLALTASQVPAWPALAQERLVSDMPPPDGVELLAGGTALVAIGALMFASAPICETGVVNAPQRGTCLGTTFLVGTPFLLLGAPLLIVGVLDRKDYATWTRRHAGIAGLTLAPAAGGASAGWQVAF
jgi:hypothetical protein